jgi:hypothetical protein
MITRSMSAGARSPRATEAGLVRGCCVGMLIPIVVLVALLVIGWRALAAPDLGPQPDGTSHGSSESVIAAALAGDAATQLVAGEHALVTLSERDLTVIAVARNPSPSRYRNPEARIRGGYVVVSADTSIGPFGVTGYGRFSLVFSDSAVAPQITARVVDYSVGQLGLPGFISDRIDSRGSSTLNLASLFGANPILQTLSKTMECVSVQADGVRVGFHRPGAVANSSACG